MSDEAASVGGVLRAGVSSLRPAWTSCWAALLAAVALTVVGSQLPPGGRPLAAIMAVVIAQGALFRLLFGRAGGLKGLRWGADEWRLLGAHLLVLGLFLLIGSILLVVIGAIALGVARASAPQLDVGSAQAWKLALAQAGPAGFVAGAAPVAGVAILVWLGLRLSFTAPATVAQSGVRVLSAFPLTKGKVPLLLAVGVLLSAPVIVAAALLGGTSAAGLGEVTVLALLTYVFLAPAWSGALAHLYRQSAATQDA